MGTGTRHAYHTNTYGHLIGEVVRRVSGEPCGRRLAGVTGPLDADVYIGVPSADATAAPTSSSVRRCARPAAATTARRGEQPAWRC